ncbi:putative bifunctional diguanylate cyclase/phosphodiesterase [Massilia niastensis]|uniref:putative bifunctional diguanylate cyclase/phosphodiesterase n=1 Tax=Massilia niastensis TaxID=544911 RepID=UPI00037D0BE1|nr:bifunctional diguanylate cyclase/phosphodiesterase [Massilia niastensis]
MTRIFSWPSIDDAPVARGGPGIGRRLLTLSQRLAAQRYRPAVYALLATVIGCGIVLSVMMERTTAQIRLRSAPLFEHQVPLLGELAHLEDATQRYHHAINRLEGRRGAVERFLETDEAFGEDLTLGLARLREGMGDDPEVAQLRTVASRITRAGPRYAQALAAQQAPRRAERTMLAAINRDLIKLRDTIQVLEGRSRAAITASSNATEASVAGITRMVHMFNVLSLLTAIFMMYHIWVRFRSEDELAHQAGHDPLTGLPDRRTFELRLQELPEQPYTVVLGTIDRFGAVVGGYGHGFGDRMIQSLVARIDATAQRHGGQVFRLDGANIAVLYRLARHDPALADATDALLCSVRTPFTCDNHELFSSLSLGAAGFPDDGITPGALLRNADAALRQARRAGGDQLLAYSRELNARTEHRLGLEAGLRRAIERGELEVYYQPQQCLSTNALVGFEALLRWRHRGEMVPPSEFIPLAEETGQIIALGNWVLRQVCQQAALWQRLGAQPLTIAVNISPRHFSHGSFLDNVCQALHASGARPDTIELEITEGVVFAGGERAIDVLRALRELGLQLSIDDFGTGYSSLAYLKRFPIHKLKIDQSFVRHLAPHTGDAQIVQAVIGLGHNLGLSVIAEGVETEQQYAMLRGWRCDEIQGHYYAFPLNAAEATAFIVQASMAGGHAAPAPAALAG